jgi:FkbM family methyltransferase
MSQFVSYAQNFEDVMLWRALKHIENGFYVDVGANDPTFDSVTLAFYERGWHGINIEPMESFYRQLCEQRHRDINLPVGISSVAGEQIFYEVPETGISSFVPEVVFHNRFLSGREIIERVVPVTTLNDIFEEYIHGPVHFLKIDVEGYEKAAVEGLDLRKWRPWILVVEATLSNSPVLHEDSPNELIIASGYTFVYFDGLNRFYIANEYPDLASSLSVPPNVFDYFITSRQVKADREIEANRGIIEALKGKVDQEVEAKWRLNQTVYDEIEAFQKKEKDLQKEIDTLRSEVDWARKDLSYMRNEINHLRYELQNARAENEGVKKELQLLENQKNDLEFTQTVLGKVQEELDRVRAVLGKTRDELEVKRVEAENFKKEYLNIFYSKSYRITAPLRSFYTFVYRLKNSFFLLTHPTRRTKNSNSVTNPISSTEINDDEKYYLNLFRREIAKYDKQKSGEKS